MALTALWITSAAISDLQALPGNARKRLGQMKPGNLIEVVVGEHEAYTGRLVSVSQERLVLDLEDKTRGDRMTFYLKSLQDVRRSFPRGTDLHLHPSDLGSLSRGQGVWLKTREGISMHGRITHVTDDEISLRVKEEKPKLEPKRHEATLPTSSVAVLRFVSDLRGSRSKVAGVMGGACLFVPILAIPGGILGNTLGKSTVTVHVIQPQAVLERH